MELEREIVGVKMILNVTEFLLCDRLEGLFSPSSECHAYGIRNWNLYSARDFEVEGLGGLFTAMEDPSVVVRHDKGVRFIHRYPSGAYTPGRHGTHRPYQLNDSMHILCLHFFPCNERLYKRKLQIGPRTVNDICGRGFQHRLSRGNGAMPFDKVKNRNCCA